MKILPRADTMLVLITKNFGFTNAERVHITAELASITLFKQVLPMHFLLDC